MWRFSGRLLKLSAWVSCWNHLLRSTIQVICWDFLLRSSCQIIWCDPESQHKQQQFNKLWRVYKTKKKTMHLAEKHRTNKTKTHHSNDLSPACKTNQQNHAHTITSTKSNINTHIQIATNCGLPAKPLKKNKKPCTSHQQYQKLKTPQNNNH